MKRARKVRQRVGQFVRGLTNDQSPQDYGSNAANQTTTFSDNGGRTFEALADGTYKIIAAPRPGMVGVILEEGTAFDAVHALYLQKFPEQGVGSEEESGLTEGVETEEVSEDTSALTNQWWLDEQEQEVEAANYPSNSELDTLMANERLDAEQISRARELIAEAPESDQADLYADLQTKVVYRNQRNNESDNESSDGGTCNLTALAMCLEYLGVGNPYPEMQFEDSLDKIRIDNDYGPITYASTWSNLAVHFGHDYVEMEGGQYSRSWWEDTMGGEYLNKGYAVLVSINGHIVRLEGMSETGVIVDDPYGASLLQGGTSRGWDGTNSREVDGTDSGNIGEDLEWSWESVENFSFKYFRAYI